MSKSKKIRVLFILKLRHTSGGHGHHGGHGHGHHRGHNKPHLASSGLLNSAMYVKDMLISNRYECKLIEVVDNNDIDREVTQYKPDIVIIEALWVVPEKFEILQKLHPNIKWIIRIHSKLPFLSGEGIAMEWINKYILKKNVYVSLNNYETYLNFISYFKTVDPCEQLIKKIVFLPNYYPVKPRVKRITFKSRPSNVINVGCFGAIRPMKNHLTQAYAAVKFADKHLMKCHFHINAGRVEKGDEVLKNLRNFFSMFNGKHKLIEHDWLNRDEFIKLVNTMDIGLQMSFSETFNIVAADFVSEGVPIVASPEIDWLPLIFTANPTNVNEITNTMEWVFKYHKYADWMDLPRKALKEYIKDTENIWLDNLQEMM